MLGGYALKNMCLDLQRQTLCYVLHTPDKTAFKILPLLRDLSEKIRDRKAFEGIYVQQRSNWLVSNMTVIRSRNTEQVLVKISQHRNPFEKLDILVIKASSNLSTAGSVMCSIAPNSWPGSLLLFNVMTRINTWVLAVSALNCNLQNKSVLQCPLCVLQLFLHGYFIRGGHTHQLSLVHLKPARDAWKTLDQRQGRPLHPKAL